MKKLLEFMLTTFVYAILYMVFNAVLPFSQAFRSVNTNTDLSLAIFLLIVSAFNSYVICYIAAHSSWRGAKQAAGIIFTVFMVSSFMTQIETLFFGSAFKSLEITDILCIMMAPLPAIAAATLLGVAFFGCQGAVPEAAPLPLRPLIKGAAALGAAYVVIYFLFGYFVAWQSEALRVFYSGIAEDAGFISTSMNNEPIIFPLQFLRGMMFVAFVAPLLPMLRGNNKNVLVTSVCLVYLTTSIVLIVPNALFPDRVRWAHFMEMISSMLLFGILTGYVLHKARAKTQPHRIEQSIHE